MINSCDGDASSGGLCQCQWMQMQAIIGKHTQHYYLQRAQGVVRPPRISDISGFIGRLGPKGTRVDR